MKRIDATRKRRAIYHAGAMLTCAAAFLGIGTWLWTDQWWLVIPWVLVAFLTLLGELSKVIAYRQGYMGGVIDSQRTLVTHQNMFADEPHPADRYLGP